ncbi:MAG: glycoside hydrolase [Flavobacteriales bacterium CG_4_10_14_0_2_um_filter_32_8]|nr:MAG: glycoside hydrolase [Flavobacteriales bacterium CG_4_10_14_0_2_um_filter_32_8]
MLFKKYNCYIVVVLLIFISCHSNKKTTTEQKKEIAYKSVQTKYATLLNVAPSEIHNITLYNFIDKWIGVKYKYGGQTQEGVDCSGFVNILYKEVYQKVLPRSSSDIAKQLKSTTKNKLSEGDILVFDIDGKKSSHVGIYLTNNKFVHSSTSKGVIISSLELPYYQKSFSKAGQL